jgi:hypothetical protein
VHIRAGRGRALFGALELFVADADDVEIVRGPSGCANGFNHDSHAHPTDGNFFARQSHVLGQSHGLTASIHEKCRCHISRYILSHIRRQAHGVWQSEGERYFSQFSG